MLTRRPAVVGLLTLLGAATTGCTTPADAGAPHRLTGVAVPSYTAGAGAPGYCAALAGSTHLTGIPAAVGVLAGERRDVEAELDLLAAIDELRAVRAQVRDAGSRPLEAALDDLVAALIAARDTPVTTAVSDRISSGLDDVGRLAQPGCGFPS